MSNGSRWYFQVWEGLIDPEHLAAMGQALWLYMYLLSRAHVAQNEGALSYSHITAAAELGVSDRTIKRWYSALEQNGYIQTSARTQYGLTVQVAKWRAVDEWLESRPAESGGRSDKSAISSDNQSDNQSDNSVICPISIRLLSYSYPTGSAAPERVSLADVFQDLCAQMDAADGKRQISLLVQVYELCFGAVGDKEQRHRLYGYIGKVKNRAGSAKRLAQLMWELTPRPPAEPLAYISKMLSAQKRSNSRRNGSGDEPTLADFEAIAYGEGTP